MHRTNEENRTIQKVVHPLLAAAHITLYFDDIFQPDTLAWIETKNENPSRAMDLFFAESPTRNVALFLIHGGGWHSGSRRVHHNLMRAWNKEGYTCASSDYVLSDRGTILEQLRDVRHGYDLFQKILVERGQSPNIVVFGDSAGAHLALLLALATPGECGDPLVFRNYRLDPALWIKPTGVITQSMPVTFEKGKNTGAEASIAKAVGVPYEQDPEAYKRIAPITYARAGSPPIFHLASDREDYFPVPLAEAFLETLKRNGCEVRQKLYAAEHGFLYDLVRPEQREAFQDILAFLDGLTI